MLYEFHWLHRHTFQWNFSHFDTENMFKNMFLSFNFWSIIINVQYSMFNIFFTWMDLLNWICQFEKEKLDIKNVPTIEGKTSSTFLCTVCFIYISTNIRTNIPIEIKEHRVYMTKWRWLRNFSFISIHLNWVYSVVTLYGVV